MSMESGPIATWVAATIAAVSAIISVVWPWISRKQPRLEYERSYALLFDRSKEECGKIFNSCGLRRPMLAISLTNNGDGTARALEIKDTQLFDMRFFFLEKKATDRSQFKQQVPVLDPGQSVLIIFLPNTADDIEPLRFLLSWREEPTRLWWNHKHRRYTLKDLLPAKHPLGYQEKVLAFDYLRHEAVQVGYPVEQWCDMVGWNIEEVDPRFHSPSHHDRT